MRFPYFRLLVLLLLLLHHDSVTPLNFAIAKVSKPREATRASWLPICEQNRQKAMEGRTGKWSIDRRERERESRNSRPWRCVVRTSPAILSLPNTGHTTLLSFFHSLPLDTSGNCEELRLETKLLQHLSLLLELSVCFWCLGFGVQVLQIRLVLCSWGLQFVPIRECNPSSKHSNRRSCRRRRRRRNCAIASKDDFKLFVVVEISPQFQ